jgi:hypothetical protein
MGIALGILVAMQWACFIPPHHVAQAVRTVKSSYPVPQMPFQPMEGATV